MHAAAGRRNTTATAASSAQERTLLCSLPPRRACVAPGCPACWSVIFSKRDERRDGLGSSKRHRRRRVRTSGSSPPASILCVDLSVPSCALTHVICMLHQLQGNELRSGFLLSLNSRFHPPPPSYLGSILIPSRPHLPQLYQLLSHFNLSFSCSF
jgi:hypothetical protein